jgi:predicted ATPase
VQPFLKWRRLDGRAAETRRVRPHNNVTTLASTLRLAISGSHATGKSTLAAELRTALAGYTFVEEAYFHLLEEGHEFRAKPTTDDIASQLRRSIDLIGSTSDPNVVFERCPVDYLAYLAALRADTDTLRYWFQESREALATLDALIFVPVERPDRIAVGSDDQPKLRNAVDRQLRDGLLEDSWDLGLTVHECHGSPATRAAQVLSIIRRQQIVPQ